MSKTFKQTLNTKEAPNDNKGMKRYSSEKYKLQHEGKTASHFALYPQKWQKSQNLTISKYSENVEQQKLSHY